MKWLQSSLCNHSGILGYINLLTTRNKSLFFRNGNGSKNSNIGFFVDFFSILFCPLEVETRDLTLLYAMLLFILLYIICYFIQICCIELYHNREPLRSIWKALECKSKGGDRIYRPLWNVGLRSWAPPLVADATVQQKDNLLIYLFKTQKFFFSTFDLCM